MPAVDGDWVEDLTNTQISREVTANNLVYHVRAVTGVDVDFQAFVGAAWVQIERISGVGFPKFAEFDGTTRVRALSSGTGSATVVLSPDIPMPAQ